jgi:DAACS family dicarboxylate/amino acid:cation (Na+ or H+) symporter
MCRTTVNVTGDLAAAVYVARGEPAVPEPAAAAP